MAGRIDTVLLDMDGTLLDLRYDTTFWQEYLPNATPRTTTSTTTTPARCWSKLMAEARSDYYCFDWWSRATGLDITALKPDLALIAYRRGAEAFIAGVRASGRAR